MSKEDLIPLKPGNTLSKDFLKTLTPEQHKEHFKKIKETKDANKIRKTMEAKIYKQLNKKINKWSKDITEIIDSVIEEGIETGNPQHLKAVMEVLTNKRKESVDVKQEVSITSIGWIDDSDNKE